jgi:hypothetical protein
VIETLPALPDLSDVAWGALPVTRGFVGGLGAVLITWGKVFDDRGVRLAVFVSAILMGHLLVWLDGTPLGVGKPFIDLGTVGMLAAAALAVTEWRHRLGLTLPGAFVGLVAVSGALGFSAAEPMSQWLGMAVGAVLLPFLYEPMPSFLGPAVGASALAWAYGAPDSPLVFGLAFAFGVLVQLFRRSPDEEKGAADPRPTETSPAPAG